MKVFTIGHSNHRIEAFIALLQQHQITAIADVRSHPYSRYLPHFNQEELKKALAAVAIHYVFLGKELGARPEDLSCYDISGKALYERIASTQLFAVGIQRLLKGATTDKLSLLCAEKDPMTCHRTILVCHKLKQFHLEIHHILSDGSLESQVQLEERLLKKFNKDIDSTQPIQLSLFDLMSLPRVEKVELEEAYQRQGLEIAYVNGKI